MRQKTSNESKLPPRVPIFDVCIVLLYTVGNDARTLNAARTLIKHSKSVCIVALGDERMGELLAAEGITFIPLKGATQGRFIKRWIDFGKQFFGAVRRNALRTGVVWASDGYVLPFAVLAAKFWKARCIYDSREIYSALGTLAGRPITQAVISFVERRCMPFVDAMFTSGQLDSEYLQARFCLASVPPVVMNFPRYTPFIEPRPNLIRERFDLPQSAQILVYQGMIFHGRGLLPVVRALPYLPDVVFVLFGEGEYTETLRLEAASIGVSGRVVFAGKVPYDELPTWTASADAGLAFIEPITLSYSLALPNKLFEYCMAGIPSIVSDLPAMRRVLGQHSIGRIAALEATPEELARVIAECLEPQAQSHVREVCRSAARELCWEAQEQVILRLVE